MSQRKRERRPNGPARRRAERSGPRGPDQDPHLSFGPVQMAVLAAGVLMAVVGFWVLSTGSITVAPILLVLGYLLLIPLGLSLSGRRKAPGSSTGGDGP